MKLAKSEKKSKNIIGRNDRNLLLKKRVINVTLSVIVLLAMIPWVVQNQFQSFASAPPASEICGDLGYWGEWSTTVPDANSYYEAKTEYRYRDKETKTSYSTSLAGYTQDGGSWVQSGSGEILYADSWPSGFNTESWYYVQYGNNRPKVNSETATTKTVVSTSVVYYIYWHWCRGVKNTAGGSDRFVQDHMIDDYTHWHSFNNKDINVDGPLSFNTTGKAFYSKNSACADSYWWYSTYINDSTQLAIKNCSYTTYNKLFNYYRWNDWSDWSDTKYASNSNRQVESRTLYRIYNYTPHAWDDGTETQPARYTAAGTKVFTCKKCGSMKSVAIPMLDATGVTPAKVILKSAKVSNKKLTIKWKRVAGNVKGYQICLKNKKTGVRKYYMVNQGKKATLSKTLKKLKKKNTYAVRLRAYNIVNDETIFGAWSNVKSGKVK